MKERILVIDDESSIRILLTEILALGGYEVCTASDGFAGVESFRQNPTDLVITDMRMPVKDGLWVLKEIKKSDLDVDVIILTGHSIEATACDCLRLGAYSYLDKPLESIDVLLNVVKNALYKRNMKRMNQELIHPIRKMGSKDHFARISYQE